MVQYYQIDKTSGIGPNRITLKMIKKLSTAAPSDA
jgi:hypothetical protein